MKLKVKKVSETAWLPQRANLTDAGLDLFADSILFTDTNNKSLSLEEINEKLYSM